MTAAMNEVNPVAIMATPTYVTIARRASVWDISAPAIRFWPKIGLSPLSGSKPVVAFALFDETCTRPEQVPIITQWLTSVSKTYQVKWISFFACALIDNASILRLSGSGLMKVAELQTNIPIAWYPSSGKQSERPQQISSQIFPTRRPISSYTSSRIPTWDLHLRRSSSNLRPSSRTSRPGLRDWMGECFSTSFLSLWYLGLGAYSTRNMITWGASYCLSMTDSCGGFPG